ncbi:hypothetical protein M093_1078 [Bacteroides uniformis str. 3978 T3 i]|nr:hypothetical protein M093_1078 [Bacteroides uniformis str. 3978 T3 i]
MIFISGLALFHQWLHSGDALKSLICRPAELKSNVGKTSQALRK